jgi:hypothetical protein
MADEDKAFYHGQLLGGPDNGNLIDSTQPVVAFKAQYWWALDGKEYDASMAVYGKYTWDPGRKVFLWSFGHPS